MVHILKSKIKKSKIETIYDFTVDKWQKNEKTILKTIFKFNSTIIVRSSAIGEDSLKSSQAGNFLSVLNVQFFFSYHHLIFYLLVLSKVLAP